MGKVKQSSTSDSQPLATASSLTFQSHPTRAERYAMGKSLREKCPRTSHAAWQPAADRPDPVNLVLKADEGRLPDLLPLRHGRMVLSPFTFYRGSALAMAVDLATTPASSAGPRAGEDAISISASSGDPALISGYLGKSDAFDEALAIFSVADADQNEKDHAVLKRAIQDGKMEAIVDEPQ